MSDKTNSNNLSLAQSVKIYLVSPMEPSGITWLVNCFLELGIRTYRNTPYGTSWVQDKNEWVLRPTETQLLKYLPALSRHKRFTFRNRIEAEWTHDWPLKNKYENAKVIFFTRDPRDSIYSAFKRQGCRSFDYKDFVDQLNWDSLLDKVDNWFLFNSLWLNYPNVKIYKFEDYKKDAHGLLERILSENKLDATSEQINEAVLESSYEKAAAAEKSFRQTYDDPETLAMRSGKAGEWENKEEQKEIICRIENQNTALMQKLGYEPKYSQGSTQEQDFWTHLKLIPLFKDGVLLPKSIFHDNQNNPFENHFVRKALDFLAQIDFQWFYRSNLPVWNIPPLFATYTQFVLGLLNHPDAQKDDFADLLAKIKS